MGGPATRDDSQEHPRAQSEDSKSAWDRRIQSGQAGGGMSARFTQVGRQRALGDVRGLDRPDRRTASCRRRRPPRPQGKERNVVITMWDWADPKVYLHDEIASDKRNPTVNANGPIYGALEESGDYLPVDRSEDEHREPDQADRRAIRRRRARRTSRRPRPSPYWGDEAIWNSQTTVHSFAMDKQGRVWAAARIRKAETPAWCRAGSDHPSAKAVPDQPEPARPGACTTRRRRQLTTIDTCFSWGHVNFDDNDVLWSSFGPAGVEGWFDTKIWDKTHDETAGAGLERVRRSTTTATASATRTPSRISRPIRRRTSGSTCSIYGDSPASGRLGLGNGAGHARRARALRARRASAGDGARRILRSAVEQPEGVRRRASRRAAWTSTARASSGRCSRADISPASIAASARAR